MGALTGIRPAKLASKSLKETGSEAQVRKLFQTEFFVSPARTELALDAARSSIAAEQQLEKNDLSLYVGIPFCPTRCAYCSFVSADVERDSEAAGAPYLDGAGSGEVDAAAELCSGPEPWCAPSTSAAAPPPPCRRPQLDHLIGRLRRRRWTSTGCTEYTVEAGRPDTITRGQAGGASQATGVDRVSRQSPDHAG